VISDRERRLLDRRLDMRKSKELLDAAQSFEEHLQWCPECQDMVKPMCIDGARLMEDVYLILRNRAV
jgi:hypothetical protein